MNRFSSNQPVAAPMARLCRIVLIAFVASATTFFSTALCAQNSAAKANQPNRYLLIVDTSFSMHGRAQRVLAIVQNLLVSGMGGEMQRGDSLGVWTFNEKLYDGRLPLQRWSPQASQAIAVNTLAFLAKQRYEKSTDLNDVLAQMFRVITNSDKITVILISDGDEKITGTPFDSAINASYEQDHKKQKKAHIPFTTVLRADHGKIIGYTVNTALTAVEFPPMPIEPKKVEPVVTKPPEVKPAAPLPPPTVPSLIISGKKTEPTPIAPPVVEEKIAPLPVVVADEIFKSGTPSPKSAVTTTVVESVAVIPESKKEPASVPQIAPTVPPPAPVPVPIAEKPKVEVPAKAAPIVQEIPAKAAQVEPATPVPIPETQIKKPIIVAPSAVLPPAIPPVPQVVSKNDATKSATNSSPATAPAQLATSVPTETFFHRSKAWIIVAVLGILATGIFWLVRRSRTPSGASLITRSLDREKK